MSRLTEWYSTWIAWRETHQNLVQFSFLLYEIFFFKCFQCPNLLSILNTIPVITFIATRVAPTLWILGLMIIHWFFPRNKAYSLFLSVTISIEMVDNAYKKQHISRNTCCVWWLIQPSNATFQSLSSTAHPYLFRFSISTLISFFKTLPYQPYYGESNPYKYLMVQGLKDNVHKFVVWQNSSPELLLHICKPHENNKRDLLVCSLLSRLKSNKT